MLHSNKIIGTLLVLAVFVVRGDDDVKYKSKSYSGRNADNNQYNAKKYSSGNISQYSRKYEDSSKKTSGFWSIFGSGKKEQSKELPVRSNQTVRNNQVNQNPVKTPDDLKSREIDSTREFSGKTASANTNYKPENKKRTHDPLLAPRQGVKAPVDDE